MAYSSIHIQKANDGIIEHNLRENYSKSVVFSDEENEYSCSSSKAYKIYFEELEKRTAEYTNRTNQKLQKNVITHLSAVVNLEPHHKLKDLNRIITCLEHTLDSVCFSSSIHRDEGKLIEKSTENKLVSGIDFFMNPEDKKLYYDENYKNEINLDDYLIEKNYHAHIEFLGLDSKGVSIKRNKLNIHYLRYLQDVTAKSLKMKRVKNPIPKKRLDMHELKQEAKVLNDLEKKHKHEIMILEQNAEYNEKLAYDEYCRKLEEIKSLEEFLGNANRDRLKMSTQLKYLNDELKKYLELRPTHEQLQEHIKSLEETNKNTFNLFIKFRNKNDELMEKNKKLQSVIDKLSNDLNEKNNQLRAKEIEIVEMISERKIKRRNSMSR